MIINIHSDDLTRFRRVRRPRSRKERFRAGARGPRFERIPTQVFKIFCHSVTTTTMHSTNDYRPTINTISDGRILGDIVWRDPTAAVNSRARPAAVAHSSPALAKLNDGVQSLRAAFENGSCHYHYKSFDESQWVAIAVVSRCTADQVRPLTDRIQYYRNRCNCHRLGAVWIRDHGSCWRKLHLSNCCWPAQ